MEVAIADETGLPMQAVYRGQSSTKIDFKAHELNPIVSQSRFEPPRDVHYKTAVPDEYGGYQFEN